MRAFDAELLSHMCCSSERGAPIRGPSAPPHLFVLGTRRRDGIENDHAEEKDWCEGECDADGHGRRGGGREKGAAHSSRSGTAGESRGEKKGEEIKGGGVGLTESQRRLALSSVFSLPAKDNNHVEASV